MVSTFTPNINLEEPARGDDVGTWDTPVNSNITVIDLVEGGGTSITLNNSPVVLSAGNFRSKTITFVSTLTGSVLITFPTSFIKSYEVGNFCTGSSAFVITLATTGGGASICAPPGEYVDVINDGSNIKFKNLGRVGSYMDFGMSSVPAWVSGCTVPPYLACIGGTFSATTYPALAAMLGGTTLPDTRGRTRYALDAGVGRVSSAASGIAGNTLFAGGGDQLTQAHTHAVSDPGHLHSNTPANFMVFTAGTATGALTGGSGSPIFTQQFTDTRTTGVTVLSAGSGAAQNLPPAYIGGITMIRAG